MNNPLSALLATAPLDGNATHFRAPGQPHVESWFAKLVEPRGDRALWLKCTVLARDRAAAVAEAWAICSSAARSRWRSRRACRWAPRGWAAAGSTCGSPTSSCARGG